MRFFYMAFLLLSVIVHPVWAAGMDSPQTLPDRINALEARVDKLAREIEKSQSLINSLYSDLMDNMDVRVEKSMERISVIDFRANQMTKILTPAGFLYLRGKKIEPVENGCILRLNVGNPNFVTLQKVRIKAHWGNVPDASTKKLNYAAWRRSLTSAEYAFAGELAPGTWTEIPVNFSPVDSCPPAYVDAEIMVGEVKLQKMTGRP